MRSSVSHPLFFALAMGALAACSSGGATIGGPGSGGSGGPGGPGGSSGSSPTPRASTTASPAPGASASPAGGVTPTPSPIPTQSGSDQPANATTSEQTFGLTCSPAFVVSAGGYSSCNMQWIEHINVNGGATIGGAFSPSNHTFYFDNWTSGIYAFDTTNPLAPTLDSNLDILGGEVTPSAIVSSVENEETATNGNVMIISSTALNEALIIDVSNPKSMKVAATVAGAPAHTNACLDNCLWDYNSSPNTFESGVGNTLTKPGILNLADPTKPVLEPNSWNDILDPSIYYHYLTEVHPGMVVTASNPVYFMDTTDPANPKKLFSLSPTPAESEPAAQGPAQSGHVGHSVKWPNQGTDKFFLGQNEGAYVGRCEEFPHDGRTLYSYDTTNWQTTHDFHLSGAYTLVMGNADQGTNGGVEEVDSNGSIGTIAVGTPEGCSAHWFDINPNFKNGGLVTMASFSFGARVLNVASDGTIQQVAWFVPSGISDTVGVYWITPRIMYLLDFETGGLDVVEYTGPLPSSGPLNNLRITPTSKKTY